MDWSKFEPIHTINFSESEIFMHNSKISINEKIKFDICTPFFPRVILKKIEKTKNKKRQKK